MREIKIRAWDKDNKQMILAEDIELWNMEVLTGAGRSLEISEEHGFQGTETFFEDISKSRVMMLYTGLKDEYEKDLYEGDVVEIHEHRIDRYVIRYIDGGFTFASSYEGICSYNHVNVFLESDVEIIKLGNIYENPELLEGGN